LTFKDFGKPVKMVYDFEKPATMRVNMDKTLRRRPELWGMTFEWGQRGSHQKGPPRRGKEISGETSMDDLLNLANACTDCGLCLEVCPTFKVTGESLFAPPQRLKTAIAVAEMGEIDATSLESVYNCPKCMLCEKICPENIPVTRIVHQTRVALARRGLGPLEKHNKVIAGILEKGNSVNGDPAKRLNWLPGEFPRHESETLLYLGCLPSYLVTEAAGSSCLVLRKLGLDFMILEDEGCCGTYLYECGRTDLAGEYFLKNVEKFQSLGIKSIIVPCNGCFKCFKHFYPDLVGETGFSVNHVAETVYDLLQDNPGILKKLEKTATCQDPCRLGRGENITERPRKILEWCGVTLQEMKKNRNDAACCGAGGGIRSVYGDLSTEIATRVLQEAPIQSVVSTCPFCTFNLNFAAKRKGIDISVTYFTSLVLEALQ